MPAIGSRVQPLHRCVYWGPVTPSRGMRTCMPPKPTCSSLDAAAIPPSCPTCCPTCCPVALPLPPAVVPTLPVAFSGAGVPWAGRLEVYGGDGTWAAVWGYDPQAAADVARATCATLNLTRNLVDVGSGGASLYLPSDGDVQYYTYSCPGSETSIIDCTFGPPPDWFGGANNEISVACFNDTGSAGGAAAGLPLTDVCPAASALAGCNAAPHLHPAGGAGCLQRSQVPDSYRSSPSSLGLQSPCTGRAQLVWWAASTVLAAVWRCCATVFGGRCVPTTSMSRPLCCCAAPPTSRAPPRPPFCPRLHSATAPPTLFPTTEAANLHLQESPASSPAPCWRPPPHHAVEQL